MNDSAEIADAWLKGDEQGQDSHVTRVSRCALIARILPSLDESS